MKLKYKNKILNQDFKYIQSSQGLSLNLLEKMYVDVFQPSLIGKSKGVAHEYSI